MTRARTFAYALGGFGNGVFITVPTVLLLFYCTEVLKIPAVWASAAIIIPKLFSIVWDPFVGSWSDRTQSTLGRRRPFMIVGCIGIGLFFFLVFSPPMLTRNVLFAWIALSYAGLSLMYSVYSVPFAAIPTEITADAAERRRLVSYRAILALIGILIGAAVTPILIAAFGGGRIGYNRMSVCIAAACVAALSGPILMVSGRRDRRPVAVELQITVRSFVAAFAVRSLRNLIGAFVLQLAAIGEFSAAIPYVVTTILKRPEAQIGTALGLLLVVATLSVPAWTYVGRRIGDRRALVIAVVLYATAGVLVGIAAFGNSERWPLFLAAVTFLGLPFGAIQVLPFAMSAAIIHDEANGTAEGLFMGTWLAAEKLGLAIGPATAGLALTLSGGASAIGFRLFLIIAPAFLMLLSLPLVNESKRSPSVRATE